MAEDSLKDAPSKAFVARRLRQKDVLSDGGNVRVSYVAFRDTRPGGMSLDVLWEDQGHPIKAERKEKRLAEAVAICVKEDFEVKAWASFQVGDLLSKQGLKASIQRVVLSPNEINAHHAHLEAQPFIRLLDVDDGQNKMRAESLAKLLAEFHANHGGVEFPPAMVEAEMDCSPAGSTGEGDLD